MTVFGVGKGNSPPSLSGGRGSWGAKTHHLSEMICVEQEEEWRGMAA
jgi:hypothetical protein